MTLALPSRDYARFLAALKERICAARGSAARSVNHELISLYWDIGKAIAEKRTDAGWGDAVVEKLSRDLMREFPGVSGFSSQNLWRMQRFYLAHSSPEFLSQAVRELRIKRVGDKLSQAVRELLTAVPWGHHANALAKVSDPAARLYYLRAATQFGWSRNVLLNQIKARAYERAVKEKKSHNFTLALPQPLAKQADEILKSRCSLEFLGIGQAVQERELEGRLINALQGLYELQPSLPAQLKGRLPSARQLAAVVREAFPSRK
jgi:predicted nuclease of restriction endonuclease-like (RecB) superfamily